MTAPLSRGRETDALRGEVTRLTLERDRLRGEVAALSKKLAKTSDEARRLTEAGQRLRNEKALLLIDVGTLRARLAQREGT